jgi:hypothetical protein
MVDARPCSGRRRKDLRSVGDNGDGEIDLRKLLTVSAVLEGTTGILLWPLALVHVAMGIWCVSCLRNNPAPIVG